MDVSKLIEWIKLSPKYLFAIAIICGFLLFAPTDWMEMLGLGTFIEAARPWVGIIFVVSAVLFAVNIIFDGWALGNSFFTSRSKRKKQIDRLHKLTSEEKEILLGFILGQTKTQYLGYGDGVVNGLEAATIIYRSSNVGDVDRWSYNIQPWVWDILNEKFDGFFTQSDVSDFNSSNLTPSQKSARRVNPLLHIFDK